MSTTTSASLRLDLAGIVGEAHTTDVADDVQNYTIDDVVPSVVVTPGTVEEVAGVLRFACEHDLTVTPAGGFVHQHIGRIPEAVHILMRLNRLNRVEHYDPGDLTLSVGTGITLAELDRIVAANKQLLPIDTVTPERVTLGGAIATRAVGPLQHRYGSVREFLLGVQFVTADGTIAKAGGRVVKNVAGYDVMKLLTGGFGTLGVIVSANLKVFPRPPQLRTFIAEFSTLREAVAFRDHVLDSPLALQCMEIFSPGARAGISDGASPESWTLYLRAGGSDRVLSRCREELGTCVIREGVGSAEEAFWQAISNWEVTFAARSDAATLRVSVPTASVENALDSAAQIANSMGLQWSALGRATGSLVISFFGSDELTNLASAVTSLRDELGMDAMAIITHCPRQLKSMIDVWGATPTDLAGMRAIRAALDPKQILNRGRFLV